MYWSVVMEVEEHLLKMKLQCLHLLMIRRYCGLMLQDGSNFIELQVPLMNSGTKTLT